MEKQREQPRGPLSHLQVIEVGGLPATYCAAHFAALGADVVKVEPLKGDPLRGTPPFAQDIAGPDRSLTFIAANADKRSIVLDWEHNSADRSVLRDLIAHADILIEATPPGQLDSIQLGQELLLNDHPGLVTISLTPFGQTGPYKDYVGNDPVIAAMSGLMASQGDNNLSPVVPPCHIATQIGGILGAFLGLCGLRHRRQTGYGQRIDVSLQEALTFANIQAVARYSQRSEVVKRPGASGGAFNIYEARDGKHVFLAIYLVSHWHELTRSWMNHPVLSQPEWDDAQYRIDNIDVIQLLISEFVSGFDADDFVTEGQARGLACTPVNDLRSFVRDPHMRSRGWFQELTHPEIGTYTTVGAPIVFSSTPYKATKSAPKLDQHRSEILSSLRPQPSLAKASHVGKRRMSTQPMLKGIRVSDLTRVFVGPIGTQFLGFFGAEVIKVESADLPANRDPSRAIYPDMNRNKLSCTIDLRNDEGRRLFGLLTDESDLVIDNFSAGVMDRLGVGYAQLSMDRPALIQVSMPGLGSSGPRSRWLSYGNSLQGYTGLISLWGHPESPMEAHAKGTTPDYVSAAFLALGAMTAIEHRDQTGLGQSIEVCMVDGQASLLGPAVLDQTVNGRSWNPIGYEEPLNANLSPFGCYRCANSDSWIVIACENVPHWDGLLKAMRQPPWSNDKRFATHEGRILHRAELDANISSWAQQLTPQQAMRLLQNEGVPSGIVMNSEMLYHDHHLRARGHLIEIDQPPWGKLTHQGLPGIPGLSDASCDRPTPWPGTDNEYVFGDVLGMSSAEIKRSTKAGGIH